MVLNAWRVNTYRYLTCARYYCTRLIPKYACACMYVPVRNGYGASTWRAMSFMLKSANTPRPHASIARFLRLFKVMTTVISTIVRRKANNLCDVYEGYWILTVDALRNFLVPTSIVVYWLHIILIFEIID